MGTVRQNRDNQINAQRSTGPKSQSGKERVRSNALKHGLSGLGVVLLPDEAEAVNERAAQWNSSLRPHNPYELWLVEQIALESLRIERCQELEQSLRTLGAERAALCWDEDRGLAAELLATRLPSKPALVSGQLRQTKQGCALLLDRWAGLEAVLQEGREWDESQRALALDLLGTPLELRTGTTPVDAPEGVGDLREFRLELVREERDHLEQLRATVLDVLDEHEQDAALLGLPAEPDRATALVRRYEAACMRRLQWAVKQLKAGRTASGSAPLPDREGASASSPAMAPVVPASAVSPDPQSEVAPGGTGRSEAAIEAETQDPVRVDLEAAVPAQVLTEGDDAAPFVPAVNDLAPMIAISVPGSLSEGCSGRSKGNRRARRAAEARRRRARR